MCYYFNIRVNIKTNVPIFTWEQSLLQRSIALLTPCQPSRAGPATSHPILPSIPTCSPSHPQATLPPTNLACPLLCRSALPACRATQPRWHGIREELPGQSSFPCERRRKLCVNMWSKSLLNPPLLNHRQISCVPPNILHMPQIWWDIPCTHPNILRIPCVLCDCTASLLCHGTHPNILSIPYGFPEYIGYSDGYLGCFNCWGKSQG